MQDTLLIELLTEELPPKALPKLGAAFAQSIVDELVRLNFVAAGVEHHVFASPRRLAVTIPHVVDLQPDQQVERRGPAVANAMKDGQPTPALAGFARSCGIDIAELAVGHDGKNDVYVHRFTKQGEPLASQLVTIVEAALKKLPAPKLMRWGARESQFIRPVHGLIMLHGSQIIDGQVLELSSGRATLGHRFLSSGEVSIAHADEYARTLYEQGKVIASFAARRAHIEDQLKRAAAAAHCQLADYDALLDEVTALVEWPAVYVGAFSEDFLKVPQECLILSMQQHQKYFPLLDAQGRLQSRFLVVSNLQTDDPSHIVHGNERVLRARLSDAKFFFEQDQKQRLDARVQRLENVVYHNKLGTQLERVQRLCKLAGIIAGKLHADTQQAERAAYLAKADLLTDMVGEFPELQGIMGMYYARIDGEPAAIATAIEGHYHPRFAGDTLPQDNIAAAVALADKLDTLVGIWGIGLIPTGDKDPFGLRRHALGVLRILLESPLSLDLQELLEHARAGFITAKLADDTVSKLFDFMQERLKNYLSGRQFDNNVIDAVVSQGPRRVDQVLPRVEAVTAFRELPEANSLAAANKRIGNILKKTDAITVAPDFTLLQEAAEKALFDAVTQIKPIVESHVANQGYTEALKALAGLREAVDAFFDQVMVMTDEPLIRQNRLALLTQLGGLMNQVADISKLAV
ncbi:glycyl-tRNA synthetase beta chain [Chitinivorax tropicus]|uniref:Glycine--tRNA ligase beta subunit n=1 Tax=Chitinivorax tropicus TaxID=714531 RepID=A0A840MRG9_9PROT|nr:glycine--tRNA ligase subunit beta [Chitinivorax tropicus]MBB5019036.1 glycyl-tRNA synthetase beta chain [Chitinivorax tropicus]